MKKFNKKWSKSKKIIFILGMSITGCVAAGSTAPLVIGMNNNKTYEFYWPETDGVVPKEKITIGIGTVNYWKTYDKWVMVYIPGTTDKILEKLPEFEISSLSLTTKKNYPTFSSFYEYLKNIRKESEKGIKAVKNKMQRLENKIPELKNKIPESEKEIQELEKKIEELEKKDTKIKLRENKTQTISSRTTTDNENQLQELKNQLEKLKNQLQELKKELNESIIVKDALKLSIRGFNEQIKLVDDVELSRTLTIVGGVLLSVFVITFIILLIIFVSNISRIRFGETTPGEDLHEQKSTNIVKVVKPVVVTKRVVTKKLG